MDKLRIHKSDKPHKRPRRLRYVQTLPTLCTLGNLLCGFGALTLCLRSMWLAGEAINPAAVMTRESLLWERLLPSHVVIAAYLIFLAMVFDALDGRLARWTRHTTDFGAQLDSLSDIVSFGIVPPLIMVTLLTRQLQGVAPLVATPFNDSILGRLAWIMAAVYACCAALRLARFNVENEEVEQAHLTFRGLPTPGAAGALAAFIILYEHVFLFSARGAQLAAKPIGEQGGLFSDLLLWSLPPLCAALGILMVSRFHYTHIANKYLRGRRTFRDVVKFLFVAVAIAIYPEITLAVMVVGYALSAPIAWLRLRIVGLQTDDEDEDVDAEESHEAAG